MLSRLMSIPHDCNSSINVSLLFSLVADSVSTVNNKDEEKYFIRLRCIQVPRVVQHITQHLQVNVLQGFSFQVSSFPNVQGRTVLLEGLGSSQLCVARFAVDRTPGTRWARHVTPVMQSPCAPLPNPVRRCSQIRERELGMRQMKDESCEVEG